MATIQPHGGSLINLLVPAEQRDELLRLATSLKQIRVLLSQRSYFPRGLPSCYALRRPS